MVTALLQGTKKLYQMSELELEQLALLSEVAPMLEPAVATPLVSGLALKQVSLVGAPHQKRTRVSAISQRRETKVQRNKHFQGLVACTVRQRPSPPLTLHVFEKKLPLARNFAARRLTMW
jgi:hypothetical protein